MMATRFHIYIIGILALNFYALPVAAQLQEQTKFSGEKKLVIVEPTNIVATKSENSYSILPYRDRRSAWGKTISVAYSTYQPENYEPNFLQANFNEIYENPEVPMIELNFAIKKNGTSFSYGGEFGVGIYQNKSDQKQLILSSLQLVPIKVGGIILLDALRPTPNFVPYVSGGGYIVLYKEDNNNTDFTGNTQVAPYLNAGMAFSLEWIDKHAARVSYEESGIEATYAFVEVRTQFAAADDQDPDFSSQLNFAGGIKVEF